MRRLIAVFGVELYAIACAVLRYLPGVRTDEAKYLLNIPYPHPPLVRSMLGATASLPQQELLWRLIFASLVVQAAWFLWFMAPRAPRRVRAMLMGLWLLSYPVLTQCGTVMMAPLTAVQGLALLAFLLASYRNPMRSQVFWWCAALLWLVSLFTAYQALVYAPLVIVLFRRSPLSLWQRLCVVLLPVGLLVLYTLGNPLAVASFFIVSGEHAPTVLGRFAQMLQGWMLGGSVVLGVVGIVGLACARRWALLASAVLMLFVFFFSFHDYYPVLLAPLLLGGVIVWPNFCAPRMLRILLMTTVVASLCLISLLPVAHSPSAAKHDMAMLQRLPGTGSILITGVFGHEWQYESVDRILRFREDLLPGAKAVVCVASCPDMSDQAQWATLRGTNIETWVRRGQMP